jgi:hypothetical protein
MLGLVGAQLKHKIENKQVKTGKAVWVDVSWIALSLLTVLTTQIGGGTGYDF